MENIVKKITEWIKEVFANEKNGTVKNYVFSFINLGNITTDTNISQIEKDVKSFEKQMEEKYKVTSKTIIIKDGKEIEHHDF